MAFRSFVGSCATLTSSVANLTILMVLKGEPAWICLMCCNADVLFSVVVLHWVTAIDSARSNTTLNTLTNHSQATHHIKSRHEDGIAKPRGVSMNFSPGYSVMEADIKQLSGVVTTQCCRNLEQSSRAGSEEQIMELDRIRVKTERTVEVEFEQQSENSRASRNCAEDDRGSLGCTVSVEKMV
jgi:hypothetical protein